MKNARIILHISLAVTMFIIRGAGFIITNSEIDGDATTETPIAQFSDSVFL